MKLLIFFLLLTSLCLPQENRIKFFAEKFITTLNHDPELLYDFLPTINELHEVFPDAINSGINDSLLSYYFIRKRSLEIKLEQIFSLQSLFENNKISPNGDLRTNKADDETENIFFLEIPIRIDSINAWFSLSVIQSTDRLFLLEILELKNTIYKKQYDVEFEEEEIEGELISPQEPINPSAPSKNTSIQSAPKEKEEADRIAAAPLNEDSNQIAKKMDDPSMYSKVLNDSLPAHSNFIKLIKKLKNK